MNRIAIFLATIVILLQSARSEPAKTQPAKVDLIVAAPGHKVFRIEAGEATVGGDVIKRVEIGKTTAVITYFNKSAKQARVNHRFRLIDAYGIEIASFSRGMDYLGPGETHATSLHFEIPKANELLQFSTVALPDDWATPVYLLIEDLPDPGPGPIGVPIPHR